MAQANDKKSFEFDAAERAWLRIALKNQMQVLSRARTREVVGGEVHALRGKELAALSALAEKVA